VAYVLKVSRIISVVFWYVVVNVGVDNLLITEEGYENLTPTPKEVDELVKIISSTNS
jgi:hypothetical protein